MKLKYYVFLATKNLFHKKSNILTILLFSVIMSMIIIVSTFSKSFTNLINNQINGNINYNTLLVNNIKSIDELKNDFKNNDKILYIADYNTYSRYVGNENNDVLILKGVPNNFIDVIKGANFSEVQEDKALICPSKLYLGKNPETFDEEFKQQLINGEQYINKNMTIKSNTYKETYKIIGIYDVNKYSYGEYNVCFTQQNNILDIFDADMRYANKKCEEDNLNCQNINNSKSAIIVIDNNKNILEIENELKSKGYNSYSKIGEVNTSGIDFIVKIAILIEVMILIVAFIITLVLNNKFIQYNKKNNLIYTSLGYDKNVLIKINYLETIIATIISFILSIIACLILYFFITNNYGANIQLTMPISISYTAIILSFIISIFVSLLSIYLAIKNNKNSIIGDFGDNEI